MDLKKRENNSEGETGSSDEDMISYYNASLFMTVRSRKPESAMLNELERCFESGARINSRNSSGNTILHVAVMKKLNGLVKYLLEKGADTTLINNNEMTPLIVAQKFNNSVAIDLLTSQKESGNYKSKISIPVDINEKKQDSKTWQLQCAKNGKIFELLMLMTLFERGHFRNVSFTLGKEVESGGKFDDVVFKHSHQSKNYYYFMQLKHVSDENKKITSNSLLANNYNNIESDNSLSSYFNLKKYFISYLSIKDGLKNKDAILKYLIIFTTIGFDIEELRVSKITAKELVTSSSFMQNFLHLKTENKQSLHYQLNVDRNSLLYEELKACSDLKRLAEFLLLHALDEKTLRIDKNSFFEAYHVALGEEVIDVTKCSFKTSFVIGESLSQEANLFRKTFLEMGLKQGNKSETEFWDYLSSKKLKIVKKFGEFSGIKYKLPTDSISDTDIEDFFDKLVFAVDQPNCTQLSKLIQNEDLKNSFNLSNTDVIMNCLQSRIQNWLNEQINKEDWISYERSKEFFTGFKEIILTSQAIGLTTEYKSKMKNSNVFFRSHIEGLERFFCGMDYQNLVIWSGQNSTFLSTVKVYQFLHTQTDYIPDDTHIIIEMKTLLIEEICQNILQSFSLGSNKLFILELNFIPSGQHLLQVVDCLCNITKCFSDKKLIVITQNKDTLTKIFDNRQCNYLVLSDDEPCTLADIQLKSTNITINFQNKLVSFYDLVGKNVNVSELTIDSRTLKKMVLREDLVIGKQLTHLGEIRNYFINRRLFNNTIEVSKNVFENCYFFITDKICTDSDAVFEISKNHRSTCDRCQRTNIFKIENNDDFRSLCIQFKLYNIHWLRSADDNTVYWETTYGSIINLRPFCMIIESNDNWSTGQNKVQIISNVAGMGKSIFITQLCIDLKEGDPNKWILNIDLSSCSDIFKAETSKRKSGNSSFSHANVNETINFLIRILDEDKNRQTIITDFEKELLKKRLMNSGNVVAVFDAYDEICPDYISVVTELLKCLKETQLDALIITTRPHVQKHLENELGCFSTKLRPFTLDEQKLFLLKYLKNIGHSDVKPITDNFLSQVSQILAQNHTIIGIPLLLRMFAEVILENADNEEFFKSFDLLHLFQYFVQGKLIIYENKSNETSGNISFIAKQKYFSSCLLDHHIRLSLQFLLSPEVFQMIQFPILQLSEYIQQEISKVGIVEVIDGRIKFIHHMFAEYFIAIFVVNEISTHVRKDAIRFIFSNILLLSQYQTIRLFVNAMLVERLPCIIKLDDFGLEIQYLFSKSLLVNDEKQTIIHVACKENNIHIVKFMLSILHNANKCAHLIKNSRDNSGRTALHFAVSSKRFDIVEMLVKENIDINIKDNYGKTALHRVIENESNDRKEWKENEVVEFFIEHDIAVIDIKDKYNKTILFRAYQKKKWGIVKYLIETIIDKYKESSDGWIFIKIAFLQQCTELVEYFFEIINDLDLQNVSSIFMLHKATEGGNLKAVKFLIENGADCLSIKNGVSLLHAAIYSDNYEIVDFILSAIKERHSFDTKQLSLYINLKDAKGDTPLMWGAEGNRLRSTKCLLEKYAVMVDVNCQNNNGNTALHWAVDKDNIEFIELLLDYSANIDVKNNERFSPNDVARAGNQIHILSLFEKYPQNVCVTEEINSIFCKIIVHKRDGKPKENDSFVDINANEASLTEFLSHFKDVEVMTIYVYQMNENYFKNIIKNLKNLFIFEVDFSHLRENKTSGFIEIVLHDIMKPLIVQSDSLVYVWDCSNKYSVIELKAEYIDESTFIDILSNSKSCIPALVKAVNSKICSLNDAEKINLKNCVFDSGKEFDGWKLIDYAAYFDDYLMARFLSLTDWDLTSQNSDGRRTLEIAAEFSSVNTWMAILNIPKPINNSLRNKIDQLLQLTNESGNTPLLISASKGRVDIVKFLIDLGSNIDHKNLHMETAVDLAWKNKHYGTVYELVIRDSFFPKHLNLSMSTNDQSSLYSLVQERDNLHLSIVKGDLNCIKDISIHSNSSICLNIENKSALLTCIDNKQFKIYAFLKSRNYKFKDDSEENCLNSLSSAEKHMLKTAMLPYFSPVDNSHIMFLVSKSRILGTCKDFKSFVEDIYIELNNIPQISTVLRIIQYSDYVDIIFDFGNDSVAFADPSSVETVKGKCDYKEGRLYIGAKTIGHDLLGTIAHELTHFAMQIVYSNNCNPFREKDENQKEYFMKIVNKLHLQVKSNNNIDDIIKHIFNVYSDPSEWASETIVRVPHILAKYKTQLGMVKLSEQVPELLEYYNQLITEMENFIESNYLIKPRNAIRLLNYYSDELNKIENTHIQFTQVINIKSMFQENEISVVLISTENTWLSSIKVLQSLKTFYPHTILDSCLYFNFGHYLKQKDEINKTFYSEACNLFVMECNHLNTEMSIDELKILLSILSDKNSKKMIIIIEENNTARFKELLRDIKYLVLEDFALKLSDFSEASQKYIYEKKKVCFQKQMENLSLKDLLGDESNKNKLLDIIDVASLTKLINNEEVYIGNDLTEFKEIDYYINRILCYQFNRDLTADPASWKEQCENTGLISEEDLLLEDRKILIVSDTAGMGKSTLLSYLEHKIKTDNPTVWVLRINLNDCTKALSNAESNLFSFKCETDDKIINFIYDNLLGSQQKSGTIFEKKLFSLFLEQTYKMVLLFDGFDEISPNYKDVVLKLLQSLKQKAVKRIIISTRPHLRQELEDCLKGFACRLKPFTRRNQIDFLKKFWNSGEPVFECSSKLEIYATELVKQVTQSITSKERHFTGIPLQIKMLAEVFEDDCHAFCGSKNEKPIFPDKIDLNYLYRYFIDKKFKIYQEDKNKVDYSKLGIKEDTEILHRKYLKVHQKLSIYRLFSSKYINILLSKDDIKKTKIFISNAEKGRERTGIINGIVEEIPQFIHRTFAEYFVACFLETSLEENYAGLPLQSFILVEILLKDDYEVVRFFFNLLLNSKSFSKNAINKIGETLLNIWKNAKVSLIDGTGNTILHITAQEGNTSIVKLLVDSLQAIQSGDDTFINSKNKYDRLALHDAISYGDTDMIKQLVDAGSDVNCITYGGSTALHGVVACGDLELVKWFIERGGNIHAVDDQGMTVLHSGASSVNVIQWLVEYKKLNVEVTDAEGQNMLHYATLFSNLELLKWLIEIKKMEIKKRTLSGETILHRSATKGLEIVEYITEKKAIDINDKTDDGITALHLAVTSENIEVAKYLVNNGASINVATNDGRTPVHNAAIFRHWDTVKWLVSEGADINAVTKNGRSLILLATQFGTFKEIQWLVENGADVNTRFQNGTTVISKYARLKQWDKVKWFLAHGADINISGEDGKTMLHEAVKSGNLSQVRWLVKEGASIFAKTIDGQTILHCAAQSGNVDLVEWLVNEGASIEDIDNEERTVLHHAGVGDNSNLIKWLVQKGLDINAVDTNGCTVLHNVGPLTDLELLKWLVKKGANINAINNSGSSVLHLACLSKNYHVVKWLVEDMKLDPALKNKSGGMAHHISAGCGDTETVKYLIKDKGININSLGRQGETVLHAAAFSSFELVKWLIENGVDPKVLDENGKKAIDYARRIHKEAIVHFLEPLS